MGDLRWYVPESLDLASELIRRDGVSAHGGGTALLRGSLASLLGLVDLSLLGLDSITEDGRILTAGSMVTYAELSRACEGPLPVLFRALGEAATTPLRNRITLGGTVKASPLWSDLTGPLIALDARVMFHGHGDVPFAEYTGSREYRDLLITGIVIPLGEWRSSYFRQVRTRVDYPAFTVTVLLSAADGAVRSARIVVSGTRNRWDRFEELEAALTGRSVEDLAKDPPVPADAPVIADRPHGSGEYLSHCALTAVRRGIAAAASGGEHR